MTDAKRVIRTMCIMLALLATAILIQVPNASAGIPSVTLTTSLSGTHYILNVTVDHPPSPAISATHYVDQVQIVTTNTSGSKWVNLTMAGPDLYAAQHNTTFSFTYDIGSLSLNTSISGKAHCVIHGWGSAGTATAGPVGGGTTPAPPADNTMLIVAIVLIIAVVIVIAAVMMRRKGKAEKPKE
jgi:hypothetical protein